MSAPEPRAGTRLPVINPEACRRRWSRCRRAREAAVRDLAARIDIADPGSILRFGQEAQNRATLGRRRHAGRRPQPRGRRGRRHPLDPARHAARLRHARPGGKARLLRPHLQQGRRRDRQGRAALRDHQGPGRGGRRQARRPPHQAAGGCGEAGAAVSAPRSTGSMRSATTSPPARRVLVRVDQEAVPGHGAGGRGRRQRRGAAAARPALGPRRAGAPGARPAADPAGGDAGAALDPADPGERQGPGGQDPERHRQHRAALAAAAGPGAGDPDHAGGRADAEGGDRPDQRPAGRQCRAAAPGQSWRRGPSSSAASSTSRR